MQAVRKEAELRVVRRRVGVWGGIGNVHRLELLELRGAVHVKGTVWVHRNQDVPDPRVAALLLLVPKYNDVQW